MRAKVTTPASLESFRSCAIRKGMRSGMSVPDAEDFASWATIKFILKPIGYNWGLLLCEYRREQKHTQREVEYDGKQHDAGYNLSIPDPWLVRRAFKANIKREHRAIFLLYTLFGLTLQEIGWVFGLQEGSVCGISRRVAGELSAGRRRKSGKRSTHTVDTCATEQRNVKAPAGIGRTGTGRA